MGMLLGRSADGSQQVEVQGHESSSRLRTAVNKDNVSSRMKSTDAVDRESLMCMAEESLPRSLRSRPMWSKCFDALRERHRWMSVIFTRSGSSPRHFRVVVLASNVVVMLFVQSLCYALSGNDDGSWRMECLVAGGRKSQRSSSDEGSFSMVACECVDNDRAGEWLDVILCVSVRHVAES